jgi:hypothetical protein
MPVDTGRSWRRVNRRSSRSRSALQTKPLTRELGVAEREFDR